MIVGDPFSRVLVKVSVCRGSTDFAFSNFFFSLSGGRSNDMERSLRLVFTESVSSLRIDVVGFGVVGGCAVSCDIFLCCLMAPNNFLFVFGVESANRRLADVFENGISPVFPFLVLIQHSPSDTYCR